MTGWKDAAAAKSPVVKEQRARRRHELQGRVRIYWIEESGVQRQASAQIRNICVNGMACVLSQRLPAGTIVRVECAAEHLYGDSIVRHCSPKGISYIVGLEFRGSLEWRGAQEAPRHKTWD